MTVSYHVQYGGNLIRTWCFMGKYKKKLSLPCVALAVFFLRRDKAVFMQPALPESERR